MNEREKIINERANSQDSKGLRRYRGRTAQKF